MTDPTITMNLDVTSLHHRRRRSLAGFETPKAVVVVDDLPETVGGKVLKYRLRARLDDLYRPTEPGTPPPQPLG